MRFGYCRPAFCCNLFVGTAVNHCHAEFIEASINNQSFDKLRMTPPKSISASIGFSLLRLMFQKEILPLPLRIVGAGSPKGDTPQGLKQCPKPSLLALVFRLSALLHRKNLLALIQELVFNTFLSRFLRFKFFQLFMETSTVFNNCYPCRANKFN